MLVSLWRKVVWKRMARAAARGGRPVLRVEGLEDRLTPTGVFAVPSAAGEPGERGDRELQLAGGGVENRDRRLDPGGGRDGEHPGRGEPVLESLHPQDGPAAPS